VGALVSGKVYEPLGEQRVAWPANVTPREVAGKPCDALIGPCACGCTHSAMTVALAVLDEEVSDYERRALQRLLAIARRQRDVGDEVVGQLIDMLEELHREYVPGPTPAYRAAAEAKVAAAVVDVAAERRRADEAVRDLALAQQRADAAELRAAEIGAELRQRDVALGRIAQWTHEFGAALKPRRADTYGEGMRDAKEQVARIIDAVDARKGVR
jgi:hypothetical protein